MYMDWENRILTVTENIKNRIDWWKITEMHAEEFDLAKEIKLPYDIKEIYDDAFRECFSLEKIKIPDGVSRIGSEAFYNCRNLKTVGLPGNLTSIESFAFNNCKSLKEINLPDKLRIIGDMAFENCSSLKELILPNSLESIGRYAFANCGSLKEINIPSKIRCIQSGTFINCAELESIKMPESRLLIEANAFGAYSNKLKDIYVAENSIIRKEAFKNNDVLTVHIGYRAVPASYFDFSYVGDFFQNPSYESMLKIQLMPVKINISMMYMSDDKRYETYLKKNICKVIDYIAKEEKVDMLDKLIENQLISSKAIDKCLECVEKNEFHEAFIMLAKYKEDMGGYENKDKRFEL